MYVFYVYFFKQKTQLLERLKVLENERLEASQMEDLMISREIEKEILSIEAKLAEIQNKSIDIPSNQVSMCSC